MNRDLSTYALKAYGEDAQLHYGIHDLETEIQRLRDALSLARKALQQIQWSGGYGETSMCPLCDQVPERGHAPDCHIGMALEQKP